jgi:hypothetical protein
MKMTRILVILDINGTLCCRIKKKERKLVRANPCAPHHDININQSHIYLRPGLDDFLKSLQFEHIGIWSSMTRPNTVAFKDAILADVDLFFTFDRSDCSNVKDGKDHASTKDLKTVYSKFPEFTNENTVIVDDSTEKFLQLENTIVIPEYTVISGDPRQDQGNYPSLKRLSASPAE